MTIASICTRLPQTIGATEKVLTAAQQMLEQDVGTLVVTNDDGEPEGIVTDRDIVLRCVAEEALPKKTAVADIMTADVHTVSEDEAIEAALEMMADKQVRRLVVVNGAGRVSGIVALDDFLERIVEATEDVGRLLRRQVHV